MSQNLQNEYDYYLKHQDELAEQYKGKVLVIKGEKVIGVFESELEAVDKTKQSHELGTFLIQKAEPSETTRPQTYHSRVAFQ